MNRNRMTKRRTRRDEIFEFVIEYAETKSGPTPTIREISKAFGLAYTTTYTHILKLIRDGRVMQSDGKLVVIDSEWIPPPC